MLPTDPQDSSRPETRAASALGHKVKFGGGEAVLFHDSITFLYPPSFGGVLQRFPNPPLRVMTSFTLSGIESSL